MAADSATAPAVLFGVVEENDENTALDASRVRSVEQMDETEERENAWKEEYEDNTGWRLVGQSKPKKQMPGEQSEERPMGRKGKKQREQRIRQITRASRVPQLPKADYKVIVRPRGGLRVTDYGAARIANCIYRAANIPRKEQEQYTICPNYQQNIVVVSTPIEEHANRYQRIACIKIGTHEFEASAYEAARENTSKGVIRGIPLDETARDIAANVITPRNPTALVAKRMGNTTNVIVLFDGYRVPNYVKYGGALLCCSLYRKQLDVCYQCGRLGHRADVFPNPNDKICRGCGLANPPENHECKATCQLCGKDHPTADRTCRAKYKTPFLVKKRRWEKARQEKEDGYYTAQERPANANTTRDRSESFPRLPQKGKSRSRSRSSARSQSRSHPRSKEPPKLRCRRIITVAITPREILSSKCTCRYGAAVALYVNLHEDASCTSGPQTGKPSRKPEHDDKVPLRKLFRAFGAEDFADFVSFDDGIVDSEQLTDDEITALVKNSSDPLSEDDSSEETEAPVKLSSSQAMDYIEALKGYFLQQQDNNSPFVGNKQPAEQPQSYVIKHFGGIDSPFTTVLKEMERSEEDIRRDEIIHGISEEAKRSLLRQKLSALVPLPHKPLHILQLSGTFPKLTIAPRDHLNDCTPEERAFYRTSVACKSVS
ncbi:hypothetical protein HPB50_006766 [Hyalomma asiaticum]|uniref:Uncharacterized protein n=1 Tax=Hyalomma asiaticum TaxID=266040 RepID=A0ACB7SNQ7_HYAAI|nr:hypothetical protein HPB50_006766 [Hyalomma asiaticum]